MSSLPSQPTPVTCAHSPSQTDYSDLENVWPPSVAQPVTVHRSGSVTSRVRSHTSQLTRQRYIP